MKTVIRAIVPLANLPVLAAVEHTIEERLDIVEHHDGTMGLRKTPVLTSRVVGLIVIGL